MAWITPKLNWLPTDAINAVDWNRIENNTAEVAAYLNSINYPVSALTTVTNRTQTYIDNLASINRIEQNLDTVRASFITPPGYGAKETWIAGKGFDNLDAIRLEQNLQLLLDYGVIAYDNYLYCGTINCGYERGAIHGA